MPVHKILFILFLFTIVLAELFGTITANLEKDSLFGIKKTLKNGVVNLFPFLNAFCISGSDIRKMYFKGIQTF